MVSYATFKQQLIEVDTQIRKHMRETQKQTPKATFAAEQAVDILAHQVIEWLETARRREQNRL